MGFRFNCDNPVAADMVRFPVFVGEEVVLGNILGSTMNESTFTRVGREGFHQQRPVAPRGELLHLSHPAIPIAAMQ
jgi:hypothetical protein